ncbi:unnamed protein product, partial [Iphiclides podalirius]
MDRIEVIINKRRCSVGNEIDSDVTLNDYIRNTLNLRGVKYMCKEGNCGACIVSVTTSDTHGHRRVFSVNSCLVSITSCEGWDVTTIEGIGDRQGYHPVQKALAEYDGTQCGYCSPGWVMSMFSLLEDNKYKLTQSQIEESFGSNTCRCTGFVPILEAFKSFASDLHSAELPDIEELNLCKSQGKCDDSCDKTWCIIHKENVEGSNKKIILKDDRVWYRVHDVRDVFEVFRDEGTSSYMLVNGNTGRGAAPIFAFPRILIDINPIQELKTYYLDQNLVVGGGISLRDLMDLFTRVAEAHEEFAYLKKLHEHLNLVAHIPVRNVFTVSSVEQVTPETFLHIDMTGKLITQVKIPPLSSSYKFVSFKIMPRSQNAHAQVNAAFLYEFKTKEDETVKSARIVIGGLSAKFVHATNTEKILINKKLFTNETLQTALQVLEEEIIVQEIPGFLSPDYRKKCALGLFYKGLLNLIPENKLKPWYRSGARDFRKTRPVSTATETYDTNPDVWPLNEPLPKLEALIQSAGEAKYVNDIPTLPKEVYCAFVPSEIAVGEIESIDPSSAFKLPGVLAFFSAKDIPGSNNFIPLNIEGAIAPEEIVCSRDVKYYNQPIGIIVAESEKLANRAALLVKAKYKNVKNDPVFKIKDVIAKEPQRVNVFIVYPARDKGLNVQKVIKGSLNIFGQYHYHMETQSCVTKPSDDGIDVTTSSQWPDVIHVAISQMLNIEQNRINVTIPRLGGGFGAKISRASMITCACALVTFLTNRPCRFVMSMQANMRMLGKRNPSTVDFEYTDVAEIVAMLTKDSEYHKRRDEIREFNEQNRWKKRGLRVALLSWPASTVMDFHVMLTVYHGDGSVVLRHGGVDMGQAVTEPPMCLGVSVAFALREAIASSRENTGYPRTKWFDVDGPFTLEKNVLKAEVNLKEFLFY